MKAKLKTIATARISFLAFDGCPLAPRAHSNLLAAMGSLDSEMPVIFEEVDLLSESTPDEVKCWGSPTILINGADVMGSSKADACGCRIYSNESGVPSTSDIVDAIKREASHDA